MQFSYGIAYDVDQTKSLFASVFRQRRSCLRSPVFVFLVSTSGGSEHEETPSRFAGLFENYVWLQFVSWCLRAVGTPEKFQLDERKNECLSNYSYVIACICTCPGQQKPKGRPAVVVLRDSWRLLWGFAPAVDQASCYVCSSLFSPSGMRSVYDRCP